MTKKAPVAAPCTWKAVVVSQPRMSMPAIMSCRVGGSLIPTRAETSRLIWSMRGPMLPATPEASVKKPAAPSTMIQIEARKPSTTTIRAAAPAKRDGIGVRRSMARFTPSIMIIRKTAMARGVRMSLSQ
ncbi:hypothetical protein [Brevundimonas vancanneytii]|uniref:Uncharacterized protein n=1 Tax=Brevundimonas vancanneytii TaxID=1325724 RepID=A0A4P1KHU4_9CAUL|nr:Uncharacterised protein [Brevundimonas vancanneytii]